MGVPSVEGYINNDKELWFDASISTTDKFEDKFGCSGELDKMIKNQQNRYLKLKKKRKRNKSSLLTTLVFILGVPPITVKLTEQVAPKMNFIAIKDSNFSFWGKYYIK